jgi:hypothetical protein
LPQIFPMMMIWNRKSPDAAAGAAEATPRQAAAASARDGLATVAAAWPTGASQLAIAAAACQGCAARAVCGILLGHVQPYPIMQPPSFCPYAAEITDASQATG